MSTVRELAAVEGSKRGALALLRELDVPVYAGVFSRRLFLARLERRPDEQDEPLDDIREQLASLGLLVVDIHVGRRTTAVLKAMQPLSIGMQEVDDPSDAYFPMSVAAGQTLRAQLQRIANRDASGSACFNVTGFQRDDAPDLYFFYIASERRLLEAQRAELCDLRKTVTDADRERDRIVSGWRTDGLRLSIRKALSDFEAHARVRPQGEGRSR